MGQSQIGVRKNYSQLTCSASTQITGTQKQQYLEPERTEQAFDNELENL